MKVKKKGKRKENIHNFNTLIFERRCIVVEFGRGLILIGVIMTIIGFLLAFSGKLPFNLGKLPGDIFIKKENFSFYFPLTSAVLISVILSLFFYLFSKFLGE